MSNEIPSHLPRGKACAPCRRRKMKCDGNQPTCNQCMRFNRSHECEFTEGPAPSTTRILEQHINRLQSRILELEQDDPSLVRLHNPYGQGSTATASRPSGSSHNPASQQLNWWEMSDPPTQVVQSLIKYFLPHATKFGFFLDVPRFVNSIATPSNLNPRPPSVLRNTVYLWGIHLSRDPQLTTQEAVFLGRSLRSVHQALSSAEEHQQNTLYVLQAEILLAYYFFHSNRILEGKFHASAAVSLAYMCNLHKILSGPQAVGTFSFLVTGQAWLPPPANAIDEGERIHAWWMTFILDKTWVVALGSPSMITESHEPGTIIDTPWPLTMELYSQQPASARPNVGLTIQRFLVDVLADGDSSYLSLHAKAAALYERANYLAIYADKNMAGLEATLSATDNSIGRFMQSLPPIERSASLSAETAHNLLLIYGLTYAATIELHKGFVGRSSTSMTKCLSAANNIIRTAHAIGIQNLQFVDPVAGVLLATAGETLVHGLTFLRASRATWASNPSLPSENRLMTALNQLLNVLGTLTSSPFIENQWSKMRDALSGL